MAMGASAESPPGPGPASTGYGPADRMLLKAAALTQYADRQVGGKGGHTDTALNLSLASSPPTWAWV